MSESLSCERGGSAYNRSQGEAEQRPNPCVRPLGPGMTFGHVAAHHAAGAPLDNNRTQGG
jgi:hypothetical protein